MAIALVQKANGTSTTATTTASFSVAPTSGNLVVLTLATDDYNGTPDAGWTQSTGMEQQTFHGGYIWWRISNGSNSLQYTIGSATRSAWTLREFSGVDPTPYDTSNGQFTQAAGSTQATPNITPTAGDRLLVAGWGFSAGSNLTSFAGTVSNSFTDVTYGGVGTIDVSASAYLLVTANGSTAYGSTHTQTTGGTPTARSGLVIAFKAAAAGGGTTFTAAAGSYALTGASAALAGHAVASAGSYTITGFSAALAGKALAGAGSYTLTGSPVTFQGKWPDATNTGYPPGTTFTLFDNDTFRSSADGEVIQNLHLTNADMIITHDNVTVQNCWFDSAAANNALRVFETGGLTANDVIIRDCTFYGHDNCTNAIQLNGVTGATVLRCNISGVDNGVNVGTHNILIRDCYIHDLNNTAGSPHYDCIEINAGIDNLIIRHCALWNDTQSQTSCININNFFGSSSSNSQLIDNCLIIDGGSSPIYSDGRFQSEPLWNVTVQDCIIRPSALWGFTALVDNTINWQWINNRDESNATLANPAPQVGVIYDGGSYALTGSAASFVIDTAGGPVVLTASAGSYVLIGASAGLAGKAVAAAGSYTLTGTAATFLAGGNYTFFCNAGAYTLTGSAATFPGYDILPPVQPSTGGGYAGGAVYDTYRLRKKRKRDEIEELIDAVIQAPPPRAQPFTAPPPPPPALVDLLPKMEAVGLTPPQRKIVKRAIVSDDEDDDDEAIELLLNLLS
jgi:hypothetical protein